MDFISIFALIIVAVSAAVVFWLYRRDNGISSPAKDLSASARAAKPLAAARRFAGENGCRVMKEVHLAKNGRFADLDFLILGPFGILAVTCNGMAGEIYGRASADEWVCVKKDVRTPFENPITRAAADTRVVRDCLFAAKLKNIPVETVCVFTNPKAVLGIPRSTGHHTPKTFAALLEKDKYRLDKHVDLEKAEQALRECMTAGQTI